MLGKSEGQKARDYIAQLDEARCNGSWSVVPELVRKIRKHAPNLHCLIDTALGDYAFHSRESSKGDVVLPTEADSEKVVQSIRESWMSIRLSQDRSDIETKIQARICMGSLLWSMGWFRAAYDEVHGMDWDQMKLLARGSTCEYQWTPVCMVKGLFILGMAQLRLGKKRDAVHTFQTSYLITSHEGLATKALPEYRVWIENTLEAYTTLMAQHVAHHKETPEALIDDNAEIKPGEIMMPFRDWARYRNYEGVYDNEHKFKAGLTQIPDLGQSLQNLQFWQTYFDTLCTLIENDVAEPIFDSRQRMIVEYQSVESIYGLLLLESTRFPKADETRSDIEHWANTIVSNWKSLLGPAFTEVKLSQGNKIWLGKSVLRLLHGAAERTYDSPTIRRHLFMVHTSLARFSLARIDIDRYLETMTKGQARAEKFGQLDPSLDTDTNFLCTVTAGIKMLCKYGKREDVEHARTISDKAEAWLMEEASRRECISKSRESSGLLDLKVSTTDESRATTIPGNIKAQAYYAFGLSKSSWARLTYDRDQRQELQMSAIENFRTAWSDPKFGQQEDLEILFGLAYTLAETHDIEGSLDLTKRALSTHEANGAFQPQDGKFAPTTDPKLRCNCLKFWHLLVLLLTARQEYQSVELACKAVLEAYGGEQILDSRPKSRDVVMAMSASEKKNLIEFKMSQIATIQRVDGAEAAINASEDLLALHSRFFDSVKKRTTKVDQPSSATSTISRHQTLRHSMPFWPKNHLKVALPSGVDQTSVTSLSPTLDVTAEPSSPESDGCTPLTAVGGSHRILPPTSPPNVRFGHESKKLEQRPSSRRSVNHVWRSRTGSPVRPAPAKPRHYLDLHGARASHAEQQDTSFDQIGLAMTDDVSSRPTTPATEPDSSSPLHTMLPEGEHNNPGSDPVAADSHFSPPSSWLGSPLSDGSFAVQNPFDAMPETVYKPYVQERHELALLAKVWLFIAFLFRQQIIEAREFGVPMNDQGHSAIIEAELCVDQIQKSIDKKEGCSAVTLIEPGYGGLRSYGELKADCCCAQAELYLAQFEGSKAIECFENALLEFPSHVGATVGLSKILIDDYTASLVAQKPAPKKPGLSGTPTLKKIIKPGSAAIGLSHPKNLTPEQLTLLGGRDRAFGLLSALVKSGEGWDNIAAWDGMAVAYEASDEVASALQTWEWVAKLADQGGEIRPFSSITT